MSPVLHVEPLGFPWQTADPFLFCVHHNDAYPAGDESMAPKASLRGRNIGSDFSGKEGFSMYHGDTVPGFPSHPHRGFETVTIARRGYVDHSDSLGATARFGRGDVQWLTAGDGIVHSEMFPLLNQDAPNPTELFQIWLNLPRKSKRVAPHFSMLWSEEIPKILRKDENGREVSVTVIAGAAFGLAPRPAPPSSWASEPGSEVAIWTITLEEGASLKLPRGAPDLNRCLYFFQGKVALISGQEVHGASVVRLQSDAEVEIRAVSGDAEFLVLQGRPIGEPVEQYGPFVMNSPEEIRQAFADYQRTQFGGWPFSRNDPAHPRTQGRFARHANGLHEDRPD